MGFREKTLCVLGEFIEAWESRSAAIGCRLMSDAAV